MQTEILKNYYLNNSTSKYPKKSDSAINNTLKGVLLNNHVRANEKFTFDEVKDSLLICDSTDFSHTQEQPVQKKEIEQEESRFDLKKAITPLLLGSAAIIGGCFGASVLMKKTSKTLLNTKSFEQLPDLAVNMNIKEEPQFAIYRAIRSPSHRNIMGAAGVMIMSGITIGCKNFVDGAKEIWLKKKSADIEKVQQEKLIEVETKSFSGKLQVVNDMMKSNVEFFDKILNETQTPPKKQNVFSDFVTFGSSKETAVKTVPDKKQQNKKDIILASLTAGVALAAIILGKKSLANIKQTILNNEKYANDIAEKTIDKIQEISQNGRKDDLPKITKYLQSICAKPSFVKEIGEKYNLSDKEIQNIIDSVTEAKKTIFADAPASLGGIPQKVQYYCYLDENRGHLYNWILNPENKFTKYIFYAFTVSSAAEYLFAQGMEALKNATVMKENAKTELDLKKRLVDVEIQNFKSKKESAISPLLEDFEKQAKSGTKSKEELKQLADNILFETKNGPPYVYT